MAQPPSTAWSDQRVRPAGPPVIVVVGDVMVDVIVRPTAPFAPSSDTPSLIAFRPGGSAANQAVAMAAAGAEVHFVGSIGDDPFGSQAADSLASASVRPHLSVVRGRSTGIVIAVVDTAGDRSMLTDRGANLSLRPELLPKELFQPGHHLHLSGYELLDDESRPAGLAALARARDAGMTRSVDPSSAGPLAAYGASAFLEATEGLEWCCTNLDEGRVLSGADPPEAVASTLAGHYREVALTLGSDGVLLQNDQRVVRFASQRTANVVDTTGAGDAFTGTFLARRLAGDDLEACARSGIDAATKIVNSTGGRLEPESRDR